MDQFVCCLVLLFISQQLDVSLASNSAGLSSSDESRFTEELLVKPLPSGHVYSHFEFTTTWTNPDIRASIEQYKDFGEDYE